MHEEWIAMGKEESREAESEHLDPAIPDYAH